MINQLYFKNIYFLFLVQTNIDSLRVSIDERSFSTLITFTLISNSNTNQDGNAHQGIKSFILILGQDHTLQNNKSPRNAPKYIIIWVRVRVRVRVSTAVSLATLRPFSPIKNFKMVAARVNYPERLEKHPTPPSGKTSCLLLFLIIFRFFHENNLSLIHI